MGGECLSISDRLCSHVCDDAKPRLHLEPCVEEIIALVTRQAQTLAGGAARKDPMHPSRIEVLGLLRDCVEVERSRCIKGRQSGSHEPIDAQRSHVWGCAERSGHGKQHASSMIDDTDSPPPIC